MAQPDEASRQVATQKKDEGNVAFKERRFNDAIWLYTQSLNLVRCHLVFGNRAQSYVHLGQYEQALRDLNEAIRIRPPPPLYEELQQVFVNLGMYSSARADNDVVIRRSPKDKNAPVDRESLRGKEDAPSIEVKYWNGGVEFEEDEMVPISICELEQSEDSLPTDPSATVTESATANTTVDEDTVPTEKEPEATPAAEDAAPPVYTVAAPEKEDTIVENTVTDGSVSPDAVVKGDTVAEEEAPAANTTVAHKDTAEAEQEASVESNLATHHLLSDETYENEAAEKWKASWTGLKDDSFSSDISDMPPSVDLELADGFTASLMTSNDAMEEVQKEEETNVKQKNDGAESEEDEMISIPIDYSGLSADPTTPTVVAATVTVLEDTDTTVHGDTVALAEVVEETTVLPVNAALDGSIHSPSPSLLSPASDTTYVSAPEASSRPNSQWADAKSESFSSDISEIHSTESESSDGGGLRDRLQSGLPSESDPKGNEEEEKKEEKPVEDIQSEDRESAAMGDPTTRATQEEGVNTVSEKKEDAVVEMKNEDTVAKPSKAIEIPPPPKSISDFYLALNHLKHDPKAFGKYFLSIDPLSLHSIFFELLAEDHLVAIVNGLTAAANEETADLRLITTSLYAVSKLPRFDIINLFMNDADKAKAFSLIDLLPKNKVREHIRANFQ